MAATKKSGSESQQEKTGPELSLETRLLKALTHATRVAILDLMNTGVWSPNELSKALELGLSHVGYHVKVLKDLELIELAGTEPRRGTIEHFYRAIERPFVPSDIASHVPKMAQRIIGNHILENIAADVSASLSSERFFERDDWHIGWIPVGLDDQACREAEKLADKFTEDFMKLEADATNRLVESGGEAILTTAVLLVFGSLEGAMSNVPTWRRGRERSEAKKRADRRAKKSCAQE